MTLIQIPMMAVLPRVNLRLATPVQHLASPAIPSVGTVRRLGLKPVMTVFKMTQRAANLTVQAQYLAGFVQEGIFLPPLFALFAPMEKKRELKLVMTALMTT